MPQVRLVVRSVHRRLERRSPAILAQEPQVAVDQRVHEQAVAQDPVLVPPIAGRLLHHHDPVVAGLVFHPAQRLAGGVLQVAGVAGHPSQDPHQQQEQGRGVAGAPVPGIVHQRRDAAPFALVVRQLSHDLAQHPGQERVARGQDAQAGDQQIPGVRLGVAQARRPRQSLERSRRIVPQDLQGRRLGFLDPLAVLRFHHSTPRCRVRIPASCLATSR